MLCSAPSIVSPGCSSPEGSGHVATYPPVSSRSKSTLSLRASEATGDFANLLALEDTNPASGHLVWGEGLA